MVCQEHNSRIKDFPMQTSATHAARFNHDDYITVDQLSEPRIREWLDSIAPPTPDRVRQARNLSTQTGQQTEQNAEKMPRSADC